MVAGGVREGWGPVAAVVLWRRMLGILGNVNRIKDPAIHAKVFECLASIWDMLAKVLYRVFIEDCSDSKRGFLKKKRAL